jgi:hypothetical protein
MDAGMPTPVLVFWMAMPIAQLCFYIIVLSLTSVLRKHQKHCQNVFFCIIILQSTFLTYHNGLSRLLVITIIFDICL